VVVVVGCRINHDSLWSRLYGTLAGPLCGLVVQIGLGVFGSKKPILLHISRHGSPGVLVVSWLLIGLSIHYRDEFDGWALPINMIGITVMLLASNTLFLSYVSWLAKHEFRQDDDDLKSNAVRVLMLSLGNLVGHLLGLCDNALIVTGVAGVVNLMCYPLSFVYVRLEAAWKAAVTFKSNV
jgi:hypothetical protein